ncbi:DUF2092 domain-containing protein [Agreia sp. COWG]|uniref:LolA family protein n=1 Tax=Agreia sp. COWG TaxID=2773266 RepID=UPI0019285BCC|nr:DUF2092 domain-containing protein [Agreia sp. COWG]
MARRFTRWIPAVAAPVVVGLVVAGGFVASSASADPVQKSPQEVLELALSSKVDAFSATIEQSSNLGLPDLSGLTGQAGGATGDTSGGSTDDATSALELLTGSHTARIYVGRATQSRVQILDDMAERDAIRNGSDVWLYDSKKATAVHSVITAGAADPATPTAESLTPSELATRFLDSVDPGTTVTTSDPVTVAGRSAYDLVLTPDSSSTLVGSVAIAVDADTGMPLSVDVYARGTTDPAFHVAYSALSLDAPSADLFAFTPPAGTDVTEKTLPSRDIAGSATPTAPDASTQPKPTVTGTGWDSIVELPAATDPGISSESSLLDQVLSPVDGGRALQSSLVSVLFTDDGRVLAGAVSIESLQAAAAAK